MHEKKQCVVCLWLSLGSSAAQQLSLIGTSIDHSYNKSVPHAHTCTHTHVHTHAHTESEKKKQRMKESDCSDTGITRPGMESTVFQHGVRHSLNTHSDTCRNLHRSQQDIQTRHSSRPWEYWHNVCEKYWETPLPPLQTSHRSMLTQGMSTYSHDIQWPFHY